MFTVQFNRIYITRGDSAFLSIELEDREGEPYYPKDSEELIFSLKRDQGDRDCILQKRFSLELGIEFLPQDTARLPPGSYIYDVQLYQSKGEESVVLDTVIAPSPFIVMEGITP